MKNFNEMVSLLKGVPSTKAKENIIKEYCEKHPYIKEILNYTYNPYIRYGVKKIVDTKKPFFTYDITWDDVKKGLDKLKNREIVGNDAVEHASNMVFFNPDCLIIENILKHDLDCGVSVAIINKAVKNCIPTFDVTTCAKADGDKVKIPNEWYAQEKLDGVRDICFVNYKEHKASHYSRTGKEVVAFDNLFDYELLSLAKILYGEDADVVFDGEVKGSSWNQTINAKASVNENLEAKNNLVYYIFDYMTREEWETKQANMTQNNVSAMLTHALNKHNFKKLKYPKTITYLDKESLYKFYNNIVENGGEGVIIKDPESSYEFKRTKKWLKIKPVYTFDGVIKGYEKHIKKDMLGSFYVEGEDENGNKFSTNVGSGFTEEQRIEYWETRESLIGKTVELEAGEFIKDEKTGNSLRFPVFKCFRLDK